MSFNPFNINSNSNNIRSDFKFDFSQQVKIPPIESIRSNNSQMQMNNNNSNYFSNNINTNMNNSNTTTPRSCFDSNWSGNQFTSLFQQPQPQQQQLQQPKQNINISLHQQKTNNQCTCYNIDKRNCICMLDD